jgi:uncharacterized protein YjbI with pentapeptide repeats
MKCQVIHPKTNKLFCFREVWNQKEKCCIFHSKEKSPDEFKNRFLEELERVNKTDSIKEFNGECFVVPPNVELIRLHFKKKANFDFSVFSDNCSFAYSTFEWGSSASFERARFGNNINFRGVKFGVFPNFAEAIFGEEVQFIEAEFGMAYFGKAQFGKFTNFEKAHFKESNFSNTFFGDNANFKETVFDDKTNFESSLFGNKVHFFKVKFGLRFGVNFKKVRFGNEIIFEDTEFGDLTDFSGARFEGETLFDGVRLKENQIGRVYSNEIIYFDNVNFDRPRLVSFRNVDLQGFVFHGSNVEEIDFSMCKWPKVNSRYAVWDEIDSLNDRRATLGELEQLYRRLQISFENSRRYAEAGDFYIGVMETRRKQLAQENSEFWRWLRQNLFSLIAWYRHLSFYGEQYNRTLFWILFIILTFPVIYLFTGFDYSDTIHANTARETIGSDFFQDYLKAFIVSINTFTFQRNPSYKLTLGSQLVATIESAISATLLALFLLALRRRFRR